MSTDTARFTTRELSKRTWPDFERFFSQVHGCACTLYLFGRHLTPTARTAKEKAEHFGAPDRSRKHFPARASMRTRELKAVKELVWKGQAHGILVYATREPVGWCHFGRASEVPVLRDGKTPAGMLARHSSSDWRITCFTTRIDHRRQGVATAALAAAVEAIRGRGGGWIEATPIAFPHNDPTVRRLRKTYRWRSREVIDYLQENWPRKPVPGIGPVDACHTTAKTMSHAGTMSMFERLGFTPTKLDEYTSSDRPWDPGGSVVMRLKV